MFPVCHFAVSEEQANTGQAAPQPLSTAGIAIMVGALLLSTFYVVRANRAVTLSDFFAIRIKIGNLLLLIAWLVL